MISIDPGGPDRRVQWEYGDLIESSIAIAFQASRGISLPASFKSIIVENDGAVPYPDAVTFADPGRPTGYDVVGIGQLYRFVGREESGWSIAQAKDAYAGAYPGLIFFSGVGNGWGFAFDYRLVRADPPVVLVRFGQGGRDIMPIAPSFDTVLDAVLADGEKPTTPPST